MTPIRCIIADADMDGAIAAAVVLAQAPGADPVSSNLDIWLGIWRAATCGARARALLTG